MNKVIFPEANEELSASLNGQFATFIDNDKFYGQVKRASSNSITEKMLEDCKPDKDHFLIHFVGVGDYEKYGFNKNCDSFPKQANIKYFKTFETDGKLYREHDSSSPNKAIGIIKKAAYNEAMGRIEVAVWANIKKASAEYEKARNGQALSCSMGMRCPYDRDNISGKLSKTPASYEPWMKKRAGQYIDEWEGKPINKYAFVHNDKFTFFDLSIVAKPAERIAHYLEYKFASDCNNQMMKAAAAGDAYVPSALIAEAMHLNCTASLPMSKQILLNKLAKAEAEFNKVASGEKVGINPQAEQYIKNVAQNTFYNVKSAAMADINKNIKCLKSVKPETLFRELAKRASILPFNSFMDVFYGEDTVADPVKHAKAIKYASAMLIPNVFQNLADDIIAIAPEANCCGAEEVFDAGDAMQCALDTSKDPAQQFMDAVEDKLSIIPEKRGKRVIQITITLSLDDKQNDVVDSVIKEASELSSDSDVVSLAKRYSNEYALYKLAALNDISSFYGNDILDDFTLYTTIAQNYTQI